MDKNAKPLTNLEMLARAFDDGANWKVVSVDEAGGRRMYGILCGGVRVSVYSTRTGAPRGQFRYAYILSINPDSKVRNTRVVLSSEKFNALGSLHALLAPTTEAI